MLGQIPFDLDLFETFGTSRFWDRANTTKYAYALAESWNKMAKREALDKTISMERFTTADLWPASRQAPSFLSWIDRMIVLMGFVFLVGYFTYDFLSKGKFEIKDLLLLYAIVLLAIPILRKFILPPRE